MLEIQITLEKVLTKSKDKLMDKSPELLRRDKNK